MTEFIIALGMAPIIVTKLTDMIRNATDPAGTRFPKVAWNIVPFVLGVVGCLAYELDLHDLIGGLPPVLQHMTGISGEILTGLGLGAVAGGWHELFDFFSSSAAAKRAVAAAQITNTL